MIFDIYKFTVIDVGRTKYEFEGYLLPNGEVLVPQDLCADCFYSSLNDVRVSGYHIRYDNDGRQVEYTRRELCKSIRTAIIKYGITDVPESVLKYLE